MSELSHIDKNGNAIMVDVTDKAITERCAVASGKIYVSKEVMDAINSGNAPKGDVLSTARIAGIMGAKRTSDLIPMCHPLMITKVAIDFEFSEDMDEDNENQTPFIMCRCTVKLKGQTGVEMEALTGVNVALLTIYDMCKALDKGMTISDVHLIEKTGGKSGYICNS